MAALLLLATLGVNIHAQAVDQGPVANQPFHRYTMKSGGRAVTFYLSDAEPNQAAGPLLVWVQGTGCSSHFVRDGDHVLGGLQSLLYQAAKGRARVLAVEKPGVQFLDDQPEAGNAGKCRPEFREQFTLNSWAATIASAIDQARRLPNVDRKGAMVVGHSEGGIVAMRVSNLSRAVTHAASLSGGGPSYLFHMAEFMRQRKLDPEKEVYDCWAEIEKDPSSATKYCWGQTYRQWSSFMRTSIIQEALTSPANLFFAHGTADTQNSITGFDVLRAELAARHRPAVFHRIDGADHAFSGADQPVPEGLREIFRHVITWFFGTSA